jgi:CRP-like cAMP-binding protein
LTTSRESITALQVFKEYILQKMSLTDDDWSVIAAVCAIRKLRKHQYLLQEGEYWKYHAFVTEGCLRRYSIDNDGIEHTIQFTPENWWTGDRKSLMEKAPTIYNIDAIEPSIVILIKDEDFQLLCVRLPVFNNLINHILQRSLNASQERIQVAISMSAEEKYLHFITTFPQLANRIPRHMLASFLGMTPESLSRIKKKLAKPKENS